MLSSPVVLAQSSEPERQREADMFGSPAPGKNDSKEQTDEREEELFKRPKPESDLAGRMQRELETQDDPLDIGGTYFERLQTRAADNTDLEQFPTDLSSTTDIYLDARPTRRLRLFAQGRLFVNPNLKTSSETPFEARQEDVETALDQLWLKFDVARTLFVTVGRQHARWGVGRFWFPNDFLFRNKRDPVAIFDNRTGVDLLKLHLPIESLGWNLYAATLFEDAERIQDLGFAGRMEILYGLTEIGVGGRVQAEGEKKLGIDLSTGVELFDLRAAVSGTHGDETTYYEGDLRLQSLSDPDPSGRVLPSEVDRSDEWLLQALVGAELGLRIGIEDKLYVGAEYFFNEAGYQTADLYPWLIAQRAFRPFYVGRHYGAVYLNYPAPGSWDDTTITLSTLGNISDESLFSRLDYSVRFFNHLNTFVYATVFYGSEGEFRLGLDIPPISTGGQLPELESGLTIEPTRSIFGVGARLDF
jgi:hypothetical protein